MTSVSVARFGGVAVRSSVIVGIEPVYTVILISIANTRVEVYCPGTCLEKESFIALCMEYGNGSSPIICFRPRSWQPLLEHPDLRQVQVNGLTAFFSMATGYINRS
jgi:hypothetical protein